MCTFKNIKEYNAIFYSVIKHINVVASSKMEKKFENVQIYKYIPGIKYEKDIFGHRTRK